MHSINWCLLGDSIVYTRQEFSRDVHQMGLCSHIYFDHILPSFHKLVRGYRVLKSTVLGVGTARTKGANSAWGREAWKRLEMSLCGQIVAFIP